MYYYNRTVFTDCSKYVTMVYYEYVPTQLLYSTVRNTTVRELVRCCTWQYIYSNPRSTVR